MLVKRIVRWFMVCCISVIIIIMIFFCVLSIDEVNYQMSGVVSPEPIYSSVQNINEFWWLWGPGTNYQMYFFEEITGWKSEALLSWEKCKKVGLTHTKIIEKAIGADVSFINSEVDLMFSVTDNNAYYVYFRPHNNSEKLVLIMVYDDDADFNVGGRDEVTFNDICKVI